MPTKYKCWSPDDGETVEDATTISVLGGDCYTAAEQYVEEQDEGETQGEVIVCVEGPDGKQTRCKVVVDFSKTYDAYDAPAPEEDEDEGHPADYSPMLDEVQS